MERKKKITIISIITLLFLMTFVIAGSGIIEAQLTSSSSLDKLDLGSGATYSIREVYFNQTAFYLEDTWVQVPIHYTENNTDVFMLQKNTQLKSISQQIYSHQEICIKDSCSKSADLNVWCYEDSLDIICKSTLDGDGNFKQKGTRPTATKNSRRGTTTKSSAHRCTLALLDEHQRNDEHRYNHMYKQDKLVH